jgi:hypothetical protein
MVGADVVVHNAHTVLGSFRKAADLYGVSNAAKVVYEVGYTAPYAIFVHENLELYHAPPTQAKYLEQPARELKEVLRAEVAIDKIKDQLTRRLTADERVAEECRRKQRTMHG